MGFTLHRTQSEKNGCLNPEKTGCFFNTIYTATYYIQPTTKQLLLKKTSINPNIKAKEAILWDSLIFI